MLLIKFTSRTVGRKDETPQTTGTPLWYAVNAEGVMTPKPRLGVPTEAEFATGVYLDGLATLPRKEGIPTQWIGSEVICGFADITPEFLDNSKPGLGDRPTTDPKYSVVVRSLGDRTVWSKGIEMMYFVEG